MRINWRIMETSFFRSSTARFNAARQRYSNLNGIAFESYFYHILLLTHPGSMLAKVDATIFSKNWKYVIENHCSFLLQYPFQHARTDKGELCFLSSSAICLPNFSKVITSINLLLCSVLYRDRNRAWKWLFTSSFCSTCSAFCYWLLF